VIVLSYLSLIMSQSHPPALIPAACPLVRGVHPQAVESFRALPSHGVCLPYVDAHIHAPLAAAPIRLARLTSAPPSAGTPPCDTPPGPIWRAPLTARTLLALPPLLTPRQPPLGGVWSQERQPQRRAVTLARLSLPLPHGRPPHPPQKTITQLFKYILVLLIETISGGDVR
jgi:hypothetical protein